MIKKFIIFFAFFLNSLVWAQNVEGIGDFKIGMSITQFLENQSIKVKTLRDRVNTYEFPKLNEVLKVSMETKFEEYLAGGVIKDPSIGFHKVYSTDIEKYEFFYPLGVNNFMGKDEYKMEATFFKGRLIFLGTKDGNSEIKKILVEKYGAPIVEDKSKMEICQNGYGAKTEHMNGTINSFWERGKPIEAKYYFGNFSCGKYPHSGYEVYSLKEYSEVNLIQQQGRIKFESEEAMNKAGRSKL